MAGILSVVFFLSGAAALLFEALWLRRAGLMLGNSVWASSIVLAGFMAGLAVGNALAIHWAARVARPLRFYALLELGVGVAGAGVVLTTPVLTPALAPLFRALGDIAGVTNLLRLTIAFALVLLPTTAMGLTLPVLIRALSHGDQDFGRVLGRLYGWNTLGGVLGALAGELWLITPLGLRGTAVFAAGLSLIASALAWWLSHWRAAEVDARTIADARTTDAGGSDAGTPDAESKVETTKHSGGGAPTATRRHARLPPRSHRLLAAAFLSGASLLALEVIWFRFLQLFVFGTTLTFAFMLAVVLLGVGAGGLVASLWLRRAPSAHRWLPAVAAAAVVATTLTYALFSPWYRGAAFFISQPDATLVLSLRLMLATSLVSGVLFTLTGAALRRELPGAGQTAGQLTLANTLGSMTGALVAGFVLLPLLGMERSIFAMVVVYAAVVVLYRPPRSSTDGLTDRSTDRSTDSATDADASRTPRLVWIGSLAAVAVCLIAFPRGAMAIRHIPTSLARFIGDGTRVAAMREGVNQTTTVLRSEWGGETTAHRLVTNGHSMSGTDFADRRYMKMYVNWAVAVNPRIRRALLISYGLGSTAKALTDTRALTSIHVVDISREILDMAPVVFPPGQSPLGDPRVAVHVEDGRFFLQTTAESFDLITGEPPPPKGAGIVNLYSREYFQLVHDRLSDGGVATYWLPVEELDEDDARAVVAAFCAAFTDCSLWTGAGAHWMLVGTRGLHARATEDAFTAQWRDPVVGPELVRLGIEMPEQLGTTFLADAQQLAPWIADVPPLEDDYPQRLSPRRPSPSRQDFIDRWMDVTQAAARFERSQLVRDLWPPGLRERTRDLFTAQRLVNAVTLLPYRWPGFEDLRDLLNESKLVILPVLVAGSNPVLQEIALRASAEPARYPALEGQMAIGALARRDYARAAKHFAAAAAPGGPEAITARMYQAFALLMADKNAEARAVLAVVGSPPSASSETRQGLLWLRAMLPGP